MDSTGASSGVDSSRIDNTELSNDSSGLSSELLFLTSRLQVIEQLLRERIDGAAPRIRVYDPESYEGHPQLGANDSDPAMLALGARIGLSAFDVDALCLVAGAHLDHDFRGLVAAAGGPAGHVTEGLALAVLLPSLDWRLQQRGRLGDRGPLVAAGLLRARGGADRDAPLLPTRRGLALVQGRHPLADLPLFARLVACEETSDEHGFALSPLAVATTVSDPHGPRVVLVGGARGARQTEWAHAVAELYGPRCLEIDLAAALRLVSIEQLDAIVGELAQDAGLAGFSVIVQGGTVGGATDGLIQTIARAAADASAPTMIVCHDPKMMARVIGDAAVLSVDLNARGQTTRPRYAVSGASVNEPDALAWAMRSA